METKKEKINRLEKILFSETKRKDYSKEQIRKASIERANFYSEKTKTQNKRFKQL